ncbi:MAG TPA: hypothetical protein VIY48_04220 [Candidatus Paceibacterota bacterium]
MSTYYNKSVTATAGAANATTGWVRVQCKPERVVDISAFLENDSSFLGTWQVQARRRKEDSAGAVTYGTAIVLNGSGDTTSKINSYALIGDWEFQVIVTAYTSGSGTVGLFWS